MNTLFRSRARGEFFCVLNPDIRFKENPFLSLLSCFKVPSIGVVAPIVLDEQGEWDNNARCFPTPIKILCKAVGRRKESDYKVARDVVYPDWVAVMFMLFLSETFEGLGGFNERYFLYYEDVDICARLQLNDYHVALCPGTKVTHYARRSSHRSFKYFYWHLTSMVRFFCSTIYRQLKC